jgi:hypothetical protein
MEDAVAAEQRRRKRKIGDSFGDNPAATGAFLPLPRTPLKCMEDRGLEVVAGARFEPATFGL